MNSIFSPELQNPDPFIVAHHRRAHSDDPCGFADINPGPSSPLMDGIGSNDDLFHMYLDMEKVGSGCHDEDDPEKKTKHGQSLSVGGCGSGLIEAKKAMAPEKLAELAVVDPKRAKRIIANRQSAARSKERKARYISELERKVQTLRIELAALSAQHSLLQRDIASLAAENNELKLRLQVMEQQAQLHEALNEALKNEVERLRYATGEMQNPSGTCNISLQQIQLNESFHSGTQNQQHQQQLSFHQHVQLQSHQMLSNCHVVDTTRNQNTHGVSSIMVMPQDQIALFNERDFSSEPQIVQPESLTVSPIDESSN